MIQPQFTTNFVEDYRWPGGGDADYDVIADPDDTRIHQGYFDLKFIPDTVIRAGIQEILLDDVRFFGNVGWRQGAQSFTAITATNGKEPFFKRNSIKYSVFLIRLYFYFCFESNLSLIYIRI